MLYIRKDRYSNTNLGKRHCLASSPTRRAPVFAVLYQLEMQHCSASGWHCSKLAHPGGVHSLVTVTMSGKPLKNFTMCFSIFVNLKIYSISQELERVNRRNQRQKRRCVISPEICGRVLYQTTKEHFYKKNIKPNILLLLKLASALL